MVRSVASSITRTFPGNLPRRALDSSKNRLRGAGRGKEPGDKVWRTPSSVNTPGSVSLAITSSQMTMIRTRGVRAATDILALPEFPLSVTELLQVIRDCKREQDRRQVAGGWRPGPQHSDTRRNHLTFGA